VSGLTASADACPCVDTTVGSTMFVADTTCIYEGDLFALLVLRPFQGCDAAGQFNQ
jgi:hypothetical protein